MAVVLILDCPIVTSAKTLHYLSLLLIQGMLGVTAIFLTKFCNDHIKYAKGGKLMKLVYYMKESKQFHQMCKV